MTIQRLDDTLRAHGWCLYCVYDHTITHAAPHTCAFSAMPLAEYEHRRRSA